MVRYLLQYLCLQADLLRSGRINGGWSHHDVEMLFLSATEEYFHPGIRIGCQNLSESLWHAWMKNAVHFSS